MARPKKETHLFFEQGADEIQILRFRKQSCDYGAMNNKCQRSLQFSNENTHTYKRRKDLTSASCVFYRKCYFAYQKPTRINKE